MKLRILNNTIRLRLSQSELEVLKSEHQVSGNTIFMNSEFIYSLIISDSEEDVSAEFEKGHLKVKLEKKLAGNWIEGDLTGLSNKDTSSLSILVEKDFQCLHKRPNEDETDSFPNPLAETYNA
jgi:hypothetical protein